ncbi:hypothetical protein AND_007010 [Anopheles darlingi]|uniref:DIRP domain-containing protein n=1 Tax=Anopheles darlingi TaxID=43151 RepID=W5JBF6_ANODA|nr:hypothetical protein AND_007010 [Anopheles darlingi]
MDSDLSPPPFGLALLGLHPVGTKFPSKSSSSHPVQVLNARGMPARIRKKNRLFYDDNIVNERVPAVKATPKKTPQSVKRAVSVPKRTPGRLSLSSSPRKVDHLSKSVQKKKLSSRYDKIKRSSKKRKPDSADESSAMQVINPLAAMEKKKYYALGWQLKNFLRLPKANRFVFFEWLYADIDRHLYTSPKSYQQLVRERFPKLKTTNLTRVEWTHVRSSFGKPRLFSAAFIAQERADLFSKREKIRVVQGNNLCDQSFSEGLPKSIPRRIPEGARVVARLYGGTNDGAFDGTVDEYDEEKRCYRIIFDKPTIKPCLVPDYEVSSATVPSTIKLNSITKDYREALRDASFHVTERPKRKPRKESHKMKPNIDEPTFGGPMAAKYSAKKGGFPRDYIGGYPVSYLELIVRTKKTVSAKQMKLLRLKNMSSEAEIYRAYQDAYPEEFKRRYAMLIVAIEKLNRDLEKQLEQLKELVGWLTQDPEKQAMIIPSRFREQCREKATHVFNKNNKGKVVNEHVSNLIKSLATIMVVAANVGKQETDIAMEMRGCIAEARERLEPENESVFNQNVANPFNYLQQDDFNYGEKFKRQTDGL